MLHRPPIRSVTSPSLPISLLGFWCAIVATATGWSSAMLSPLNAADSSLKPEIRTWTSYEGKVLTAAYVSSDGKKVTLDRRNGSDPVTIDIERLKFEDQVFVAGMEAGRKLSGSAADWPETVAIPDVQVTQKTTRNFETANFSFLCELDTSEEFVKEAAVYFEGTLAAVRALPFDLRADPPPGWERFVATLAQRESFESLIADLPRTHPSENLMAVYIGKHQQIVVPYDSIEGRTRDGLPGLRLNQDSGVLIHEITHQVTSNAVAILPYWLSDGLAEYLSVVPIRDGAFHFSRQDVEARLKQVLEERYQQTSLEIMHPRDLMDPLEGKTWANDTGDNLAGLLTCYYLIYLQNPDFEGKTMTAAVRTLRAIDDRAWELISAYNEALDKTAPAIEKYRADMERFRKAAQAYNKRLDAVREGKPVLVEGSGGGDGRVVVGGGITSPPVAPSKPEVPDILKHRRNDALSIGDFSLPMTTEVLLDGSSYDQLAEDMKAAYAEIGLSISVRPAARKPKAKP